MLNHIWAFLVVVGVLVGFSSAIRDTAVGVPVQQAGPDGTTITVYQKYNTGLKKAEALAAAGNKITQAAVNSVSFRYADPATGIEKQGAVGLAIDYIGIMALWLGFMKIAEASGLIQLLARAIRPLFRFVFPTVPVEHPAAGAMLMNIAANMLGLDNAATPLGIKAMKELQELNRDKETASNAMCMFLAQNVSSLMLLPASIIGLRAASGSKAPTAFMVPMLIATGCGHIVAFLVARLHEKFTRDTRSTLDPPEPGDVEAAEEEAQ